MTVSFCGAAVVLKAMTVSFCGAAVVLNAMTVSFRAAAVVLKAMTVSFRGAAVVLKAMTVSFCGAAVVLKAMTVSFCGAPRKYMNFMKNKLSGFSCLLRLFCKLVAGVVQQTGILQWVPMFVAVCSAPINHARRRHCGNELHRLALQ
jgi:hypothetical protein